MRSTGGWRQLIANVFYRRRLSKPDKEITGPGVFSFCLTFSASPYYIIAGLNFSGEKYLSSKFIKPNIGSRRPHYPVQEKILLSRDISIHQYFALQNLAGFAHCQ